MITEKHRLLLSGPIKGKSVFDLPGIGEVYGSRLMAAGYTNAEEILNQYLSVNGDQKRFTSWLNDACGAKTTWSNLCFSALRDYSQIKDKFENKKRQPQISQHQTHNDEDIKNLQEQLMKRKGSYSKLVQNYDKLVSTNATLFQQKRNSVEEILLARKRLVEQKVLYRKSVRGYDNAVNRYEEHQKMLQKNFKEMVPKMEAFEQLTFNRKKYLQRKRNLQLVGAYKQIGNTLYSFSQHFFVSFLYFLLFNFMIILKNMLA